MITKLVKNISVAISLRFSSPNHRLTRVLGTESSVKPGDLLFRILFANSKSLINAVDLMLIVTEV